LDFPELAFDKEEIAEDFNNYAIGLPLSGRQHRQRLTLTLTQRQIGGERQLEKINYQA
jgi:hypothetical protein